MKHIKYAHFFSGLIIALITLYYAKQNYIISGWMSFIIIIAMLIFIFLFLEAKLNLSKPEGEIGNTYHGSARWAEEKEVLNNGFEVLSDKSKGLYVGGNLVRSKEGHVLTVGKTGGGKGAALIVNNLLLEPTGSYFVTDPKGENAFITAKWQKSRGQNVYIIDPWGLQQRHGAVHGLPSSGIDLFYFIKKHPDKIQTNCAIIASLIIRESGDSRDKFWVNSARDLIETFLLHIVSFMDEQDHNIRTLYDIIGYQGEDWAGLLFDMIENQAYDGIISSTAKRYVGVDKTENPLASTFANINEGMAVFKSAEVRKSLGSNDFDPYSLTDGKTTVYLVFPYEQRKTNETWLRLIVGIILTCSERNPNKRVNFILDEFGILGKIEAIETAIQYVRGFNISLWLFVQDLATLAMLYNEKGINKFINNMSLIQFFKSDDPFTIEVLQKLLGNKTSAKRTGSTSFDSRGEKSYSEGREEFSEPLMDSHAIQTEQDIINISDGMKFKTQKVSYYLHEPFKSRACKPPMSFD